MPSTLLNPNDPETFLKCSFYLSSGGCVAFPTETVYGLGANALNKEAVLSIFRFKGRPLSDPLIVHCKDASAAKELVILDDDIVNNENDVDPDQKTTVASAELHQPSASSIAFDKLASSFWPGPLTLVAKAVERIPRLITAETGFVGVRVPKHPVAMALLQACGLPIAAPSANRFGHVSPTSARHVVEDLGQHPIYILEGSGKDVNDVDDNGLFAQHNASSSSSSSCAVGIESTVAKIEGFDVAVGEEGLVIDEEKKSDEVEEMGERRRLRRQRSVKITILRKGGVSATEIRDALSSLSSQGIHVTVQLASLPSSSSSTPSSSSSSSSTTTSTSSSALDSSLSSKIKPSLESSSIINGDTLTSTTTSTSAVTTTTDTTTDTLHHQAPGMLLSHYAPDIPAFLVTPEIDASQGGGGGGGGGKGAVATAAPLPEIGSSVIVDFNKRLFHLRESSLAYRDLSQDGSAEEACRVVFETLRWAESVVGATSVLIADPHHTVKRRGIDSGNDASSSSISSASPGDRLDALRDRLYRAASGKSIQL